MRMYRETPPPKMLADAVETMRRSIGPGITVVSRTDTIIFRYIDVFLNEDDPGIRFGVGRNNGRWRLFAWRMGRDFTVGTEIDAIYVCPLANDPDPDDIAAAIATSLELIAERMDR